MSNVNPNNNFHWRDKLEGLEHLPGEIFNKDAAWDKLHKRLRWNKGHKKIVWYWVAAACLLFALLVTLIDHYKSDQEISKTETTINKSKGTFVQDSITKEGNMIRKINIDLRTKNKIAAVTERSNHAKHSIIHTEIISKIRLNETIGFDVETKPLIKPLQILNSTASTIIPEKKKLRVVHINELGDPVVESLNMAHDNDRHSFKLELAKGEVFVNSSVVSKTTGFTILKTKPSSN